MSTQTRLDLRPQAHEGRPSLLQSATNAAFLAVSSCTRRSSSLADMTDCGDGRQRIERGKCGEGRLTDREREREQVTDECQPGRIFVLGVLFDLADFLPLVPHMRDHAFSARDTTAFGDFPGDSYVVSHCIVACFTCEYEGREKAFVTEVNSGVKVRALMHLHIAPPHDCYNI